MHGLTNYNYILLSPRTRLSIEEEAIKIVKVQKSTRTKGPSILRNLGVIIPYILH